MRVHTLTLIEPPPTHVPSAAGFRAANVHFQAVRHGAGVGAALDQFLTLLSGPQWRTELEHSLPGSVAQMESDAATFFDIDIPALLEWQFTAADAGHVTAPVLYVGGTDSGPMFAEVRKLMLAWLPQAEDVVIRGADHSLATSHPAEIAAALATFLQRHKIRSGLIS